MRNYGLVLSAILSLVAACSGGGSQEQNGPIVSVTLTPILDTASQPVNLPTDVLTGSDAVLLSDNDQDGITTEYNVTINNIDPNLFIDHDNDSIPDFSVIELYKYTGNTGSNSSGNISGWLPTGHTNSLSINENGTADVTFKLLPVSDVSGRYVVGVNTSMQTPVSTPPEGCILSSVTVSYILNGVSEPVQSPQFINCVFGLSKYQMYNNSLANETSRFINAGLISLREYGFTASIPKFNVLARSGFEDQYDFPTQTITLDSVTGLNQGVLNHELFHLQDYNFQNNNWAPGPDWLIESLAALFESETSNQNPLSDPDGSLGERRLQSAQLALFEEGGLDSNGDHVDNTRYGNWKFFRSVIDCIGQSNTATFAKTVRSNSSWRDNFLSYLDSKPGCGFAKLGAEFVSMRVVDTLPFTSTGNCLTDGSQELLYTNPVDTIFPGAVVPLARVLLNQQTLEKLESSSISVNGSNVSVHDVGSGTTYSASTDSPIELDGSTIHFLVSTSTAPSEFTNVSIKLSCDVTDTPEPVDPEAPPENLSALLENCTANINQVVPESTQRCENHRLIVDSPFPSGEIYTTFDCLEGDPTQLPNVGNVLVVIPHPDVPGRETIHRSIVKQPFCKIQGSSSQGVNSGSCLNGQAFCSYNGFTTF